MFVRSSGSSSGGIIHYTRRVVSEAGSDVIVSRRGSGLIVIGSLRKCVMMGASSILVVYPHRSSGFGRILARLTARRGSGFVWQAGAVCCICGAVRG